MSFSPLQIQTGPYGFLDELENLLAANGRAAPAASSSSDLGTAGHSSSSAYSSSQSGQGSSGRVLAPGVTDPISLQATSFLAGLPHAIPGILPGGSQDGSQIGLVAASREMSMEADPLLMELLWPSWPARLPPPNLLHHLYVYPSSILDELLTHRIGTRVDIFFASHPHADRLLHRPTFLASLALPPNHPHFPHSSLLHAIAALASLHNDPAESAQFRFLGEFLSEVLEEKRSISNQLVCSNPKIIVLKRPLERCTSVTPRKRAQNACERVKACFMGCNVRF